MTEYLLTFETCIQVFQCQQLYYVMNYIDDSELYRRQNNNRTFKLSMNVTWDCTGMQVHSEKYPLKNKINS